MGRIKQGLILKRHRNYKKLWPLLVIALVVVVWGLYHAAKQGNVLEYAKSTKLTTGVEIIKGQGQIYYEFKGKRTFVTHDDKNHLSPNASGTYIVWLDETNGQYQVVLYDLKTKQQLPLSILGNNTNASIDHDRVAWENNTNNVASIYYFDGSRVRLISGTQAAIRPFVYGDQVLFAQQASSRKGVWQTLLYDGITKQSKVVAEGSAAQAAWPRFEDGQIKTSIQNSAKYYY